MSCESTCVLLCGSEPLKFVLFLHKIWCVCRRPVNFLTFPMFCCWPVQYLGKWVSCYVSFEILTAVTVESIVFWAVTLCSLVEIYWLLWRTQFLCLNMTGSSIVLVKFYNATQYHISEYSIPRSSVSLGHNQYFVVYVNAVVTYLCSWSQKLCSNSFGHPLLIYVCIYHSKLSGFLYMHTWISCLVY